MGVSQKSKGVTWASDYNLCQVKLFLSEDSPSQVRVGTQDHLQAKASHTGGGKGSDENLPPGFEGLQPSNPLAAKLSQIPVIKWRRPLIFTINPDWQVVACEESEEVETQNHRELRVLEAIYPRPSSIPPNPSPLANTEIPTKEDQPIPVVPITPIEDEDTAATINTSFGSMPTSTIPHSSHGTFSSREGSEVAIPQTNGTISATAAGVEPDMIAAAQAALTSIMSNSGDQGNNSNLIDHGLLIKILSDRKLIEQLITNRNNAPTPSSSTQNTQNMAPWSSSQGLPSVVGSSNAVGSSSMHNVPNPRPPPPNNNPFNNISSSRWEPLSFPARPIPPPPGPLFYPLRGVNQMPEPGSKDANYYKNLVQQHGMMGTNQEHMSNPMMMKPRESKPKIMRPCIYFNTAKGCRHGADCAYQHDVISPQQRVGIPEVHGAKRSKLDS